MYNKKELNSLWKEEKKYDSEIGYIPELPEHDGSKKYLDVDLVRGFLFKKLENQEGIETLTWSNEDLVKTKKEIHDYLLNKKGFNPNETEILRVCFDFDRDVIRIKTSNMEEIKIQGHNLEDDWVYILKMLHMEEFSTDDITMRLDAMFLFNDVTKSKEKRYEFFNDFINIINKCPKTIQDINLLTPDTLELAFSNMSDENRVELIMQYLIFKNSLDDILN